MPQPSAPVPVASNPETSSCDCLAHVYGNAAGHGERRRHYLSDMSDAEWAEVRAAMPVPGWLEGCGGQPESYCDWQMIDAIRFLVDNGITWRAMPVDFPVRDRVYAFFRRWRDKGLVKRSTTGCVGRPVPRPAGTRSRPQASSTPADQHVRGDGAVVDDHDHEPPPGAAAALKEPGVSSVRRFRTAPHSPPPSRSPGDPARPPTPPARPAATPPAAGQRPPAP